VSVVQLVEHQVVILGVAGSSPVTHPTGQRVFLAFWPSRLHKGLQRYCNAASCLTALLAGNAPGPVKHDDPTS
jgi:hypothetical protein